MEDATFFFFFEELGVSFFEDHQNVGIFKVRRDFFILTVFCIKGGLPGLQFEVTMGEKFQGRVVDCYSGFHEGVLPGSLKLSDIQCRAVSW